MCSALAEVVCMNGGGCGRHRSTLRGASSLLHLYKHLSGEDRDDDLCLLANQLARKHLADSHFHHCTKLFYFSLLHKIMLHFTTGQNYVIFHFCTKICYISFQYIESQFGLRTNISNTFFTNGQSQ